MKQKWEHEQIRENIVSVENRKNHTPTMGIILSYDRDTNMATVMTAMPGSFDTGEQYSHVPCPSNIGVQGVAPEPGRPCTLLFPYGNHANPIILNYFSPNYQKHDRDKQSRAQNELPHFMTEL